MKMSELFREVYKDGADYEAVKAAVVEARLHVKTHIFGVDACRWFRRVVVRIPYAIYNGGYMSEQVCFFDPDLPAEEIAAQIKQKQADLEREEKAQAAA